jgi:signal transduction histidine kinase
MELYSQHVAQELRRRRFGLLLAGGALAPFSLLDLTLPNGRVVALAGVAWTAALLTAGLLQRPWRPRLAAAGIALAVVASVGGTLAKVQATGGSPSPFFGLLLALAPVAALVVPELPGAALAVGLLGAVGGAAIRQAEGRGAADVIYWMALAGGCIAVSLYASGLARRQARRELALERQQREAQQELAQAEVQHLRMERLAAAGRLAAAVSHEVNNPLAAIRANLAWLQRECTAADAERREVLGESLEAIQRINLTMGQLRQVASDAVELGPKADPAES